MEKSIKPLSEKINYGILIALVSAVIFLLTFPRTEPDFGPGLDSSYVWALNHLFSFDYQKLTDICYPFGPLGYLKFPLPVGSNLLTGTLIFSILKLIFIASLLLLLNQGKPVSKRMVFPAIITLIISYFCDIDLLITGSCIISGIFFLRNQNLLVFSVAVLLASLGLFIKSSIGVNCFTVVTAIIIISYLDQKNTLQLIKLILSALLLLIIPGLLVFRSFADLFNYLVNVMKLTAGYSGALAVYPENSWFALGLFILTIIVFPLIIREKESRLIWLMMAIPLFIIWKHSMSREDITHNRIMLYFLFFYWGILAGTAREKTIVLFLIPAVSILSYYRNMVNLDNYQGYRIEIAGINNFHSAVIDIKNFNRKYENISLGNLHQSRLDSNTLTIIGNSTIDFYPWELSYAAANQLNWLPRKTLQSGSFSRWLDRKSSESFSTADGPDYLLLHYVNDNYGGRLGSIDGRYMLNDEPLTMINIFRNYKPELSTSDFILLGKSDTSRLSDPVSERAGEADWEEWSDVPFSEGVIVRAKVRTELNLRGNLKALLFKTDPVFVDYALGNGDTLKYRFNRLNAEDGLWLNPFYRNSLDETPREKVEKIRFSTPGKGNFRKKILLEFESYRATVPVQ